MWDTADFFFILKIEMYTVMVVGLIATKNKLFSFSTLARKSLALCSGTQLIMGTFFAHLNENTQQRSRE